MSAQYDEGGSESTHPFARNQHDNGHNRCHSHHHHHHWCSQALVIKDTHLDVNDTWKAESRREVLEQDAAHRPSRLRRVLVEMLAVP